MKKYLLDTNICIYLLKNQFALAERIALIGDANCVLSEITIAELKFGVAKSVQKEKNTVTLQSFLERFAVLPIIDAIDVFATEKARLQSIGQPVADFDLLIGATAIANSLILVTRNVSDFERMEGIVIENWIS